jgi:hypothetical protein
VNLQVDFHKDCFIIISDFKVNRAKQDDQSIEKVGFLSLEEEVRSFLKGYILKH